MKGNTANDLPKVDKSFCWNSDVVSTFHKEVRQGIPDAVVAIFLNVA